MPARRVRNQVKWGWGGNGGGRSGDGGADLSNSLELAGEAVAPGPKKEEPDRRGVVIGVNGPERWVLANPGVSSTLE